MTWIFCKIRTNSRERLKHSFSPTSSAWFVKLQGHLCFKLIKTRTDYLDSGFQLFKLWQEEADQQFSKMQHKPRPQQGALILLNEKPTQLLNEWGVYWEACSGVSHCVTRSEVIVGWARGAQLSSPLQRAASTQHLWLSITGKQEGLFPLFYFFTAAAVICCQSGIRRKCHSNLANWW